MEQIVMNQPQRQMIHRERKNEFTWWRRANVCSNDSFLLPWKSAEHRGEGGRKREVPLYTRAEKSRGS